MTNSVGYYQETAWAANVFGRTTEDVNLDEVGFFIPSDGAKYELYLNPDIKEPKEGFNERILLAKGEVPYAGYYTVTFKPQRIKKGSFFSPILKITTPDYNQPIPVEQRYNNFCSRARAYSGESYISKDGKVWEDLTSKLSANVCIKAMTRPANGSPEPSEPTEPTKTTQPTEPSPTSTPTPTKKPEPTKKPNPTQNPEPTQTVEPVEPTQSSGRVQKITLRADKNSLQVNEKVRIIADIEPKSAQNTSLQWICENNLGMMDQWGYFHAYRAGEEIITAKTSDGNEVSGSIRLTITPKVKKQLKIGITVETSKLKAGEQLKCRFVLTDQDEQRVPRKFFNIRILEPNGQPVTWISGFTNEKGEDYAARTLAVGLDPGLYTVEAFLQNDRDFDDMKETASFRILGENEKPDEEDSSSLIYFANYVSKPFYSFDQDKGYTFIFLKDANRQPIRWLRVTLNLIAPNGEVVGTLEKVTDYYGRVYSYIQPNLAKNNKNYTPGTYTIEVKAPYKERMYSHQVHLIFR